MGAPGGQLILSPDRSQDFLRCRRDSGPSSEVETELGRRCAGSTLYQNPRIFGQVRNRLIYGYIRTSRAAVDSLADAGVEPVNTCSDEGVSGSVPAGERPGWTGLDARLLRGDTVTVAALDS